MQAETPTSGRRNGMGIGVAALPAVCVAVCGDSCWDGPVGWDGNNS
jgi:hypothetical protein